MSKAIVVCVTILVVSLLFFGCDRKEEKPVPKAPEKTQMFNPEMMQQGQQAQPQGAGAPHGEMKPKTAKSIVVPDAVKGTWSKVTLVLEDRTSKKKTEYVVKIGSSIEIPGSGLKVDVGEFLPDFQMTDTSITSKSNEPNNPAVRVEVFEKGQSIYKNWIYSKFPDIHKFEHDRFGISLKEGVRT